MAVIFETVVLHNFYGSYDVVLRGELTQKSQSIAGNYSNVERKVSVFTTGGTYSSYNIQVWVNGNTVYHNPSGSLTISTTPTVFLHDTIQVPHNNNGTGSAGMNAKFSGYFLSAFGTGSGSISLTTIPRASSFVSFNSFDVDGELFAITNKKYSAYRDELHVWKGSENFVKAITDYTSGDKFTFTDSEKNIIYNAMTDENEANFVMTLITFNGNTEIGRNVVNVKGSISDAHPIMNNFSYNTTNYLNLANNKTIINGYSNLNIVLSEATPKKGATISRYQVTCGDKTVTSTTLNVNIENVNSDIITAYAIDSRGNSISLQQVASSFVDYKPILLSEFGYFRSDGGIGSEVTISANGTRWVGNFGILNNTINGTYVFKEVSSDTWINGTSVLSFSTGSSFTLEQQIKGDLEALGFDVEKNFNIKLTVNDKLSIATKELVLSKGVPTVSIHKDGISFGSFYDENIGGKIQGIYDVGDLFLSMNPTNPSHKFGGVWELIGKGRTLVGVDENDSDFNETNKELGVKETNHAFYTPPLNTANDQNAPQTYLNRTEGLIRDWVAPTSTLNANRHVAAVESIAGNVNSGANNWPTEVSYGRYKSTNIQPSLTTYIWQRTA